MMHIISTYSCQSSRAVPSKYLKYAANALNTLFVPPPTTFCFCVTKTDLSSLFLLVCLKFELFKLTFPDFDNCFCNMVSIDISLSKAQLSFNLEGLSFTNFFKLSKVGSKPDPRFSHHLPLL